MYFVRLFALIVFVVFCLFSEVRVEEQNEQYSKAHDESEELEAELSLKSTVAAQLLNKTVVEELKNKFPHQFGSNELLIDTIMNHNSIRYLNETDVPVREVLKRSTYDQNIEKLKKMTETEGYELSPYHFWLLFKAHSPTRVCIFKIDESGLRLDQCYSSGCSSKTLNVIYGPDGKDYISVITENLETENDQTFSVYKEMIKLMSDEVKSDSDYEFTKQFCQIVN